MTGTEWEWNGNVLRTTMLTTIALCPLCSRAKNHQRISINNCLDADWSLLMLKCIWWRKWKSNLSDSVDYQNAWPIMNFLSVFRHAHDQCFVPSEYDRLMPVAVKAMHQARTHNFLPKSLFWMCLKCLDLYDRHTLSSTFYKMVGSMLKRVKYPKCTCISSPCSATVSTNLDRISDNIWEVGLTCKALSTW